MKVRIGTIVKTEFGTGAVVAITEEWLIHKDKSGMEMCVNISEDWIGIPANISDTDIPNNEIEIKE